MHCNGLGFCVCRRLRKLGISWERRRLAPGYDGWYDDERRTIVTDERLDHAEARSVLAHELVHAERRDVRTESAWTELQQEYQVDVIAARLLLPLDVLADALCESGDEVEAAVALGVTLNVLHIRMSDMTPAESAYVGARVEAASRREVLQHPGLASERAEPASDPDPGFPDRRRAI